MPTTETNPNRDPRVLEVTADLTAQINAMTPDQRALFIDTALQNIHSLSQKVAESPTEALAVQGWSATIHALTSLTGLANSIDQSEEQTEEDVDTVNRVLVRFEDLLRAASTIASEAVSAETPETKGAEEPTVEEFYGQYL